MNKIVLTSLFYFLLVAFFNSSVYAQNYDAELVDQHTTTTLKNRKLSRFHSFDIRINNRAGEEYSEIEIPFSKLTHVSGVEAHIEDLNGKIIKKLSRSDIKEHSSFPSFSFYEDVSVKEFTIKHNVYPYIIHYEFEEKEDQFIWVDYWLPILDSNIPTKKSTLTIEVPKDYKINFKAKNISSFKKDSTDEMYTYQWTAEYRGDLKTQSFSAPIKDSFPSVMAIPETFNFEEEGSFRSWESFGAWQYKLIKNIVDLPDDEIARIKKQIRGIQDKEQIIKTLYNYLQDQTRYINISIETGGLKPYPASYVAEKRYGDCKALSNYFVAVLKAVDIDSYYTKIAAGETIERIDHTIPSQQSNHIIVCVPLEKDTLWLDCTSDNPFKYVGTFIQGREVFVINHDESFFAHTPPLSPSQVLTERNIKLAYAADKTTNAAFTTIYRGKQYEILNQLSTNYNENERHKILREIVVEDSFEPAEITFTPPHRDSTSVTLNYLAKSSNIYKAYGNDIVIKSVALNLPSVEKPDERTFPVQINYPRFQKDIQTYSIPSGYQVESIPKKTLIESEFGSYSVEAIQSDNEVIVTKQFLLKRGNYPLEKYSDLYNFLSAVSSSEKSMYITNTKTK